MTLDELKGIVGGLMREDDTPERIDAFNSIIEGYDTSSYETKYNEMVEKYNNLENQYRETFKKVLEPNETIVKEEKTEPELENSTTWEDIFK